MSSPKEPAALHGIGARFQGHLARRSSGNGKTDAGTCGSGRGGRAVLLGSGSDFMESSSAWGEPGARPLCDSRKQSPTIVFVDEIARSDETARRGDRRRSRRAQTDLWNQMLSEMDGLRADRGRSWSRRHEPARRRRPPLLRTRPASTARLWFPCRT